MIDGPAQAVHAFLGFDLLRYRSFGDWLACQLDPPVVTKSMLEGIRVRARIDGLGPVVFVHGTLYVGPLTAGQYSVIVDAVPEPIDLERLNCLEVGVGHSRCGWCDAHSKPRARCGCLP